MKKSYYKAINSNREIAGVRFEPVAITGGTLFGVLGTDDKALKKALDDLVREPKNGVEPIDEAEYSALLKKKAPHLAELRHSNRHTEPLPMSDPVQVAAENPDAVVTRRPKSTPRKDEPEPLPQIDIGEVLSPKKVNES